MARFTWHLLNAFLFAIAEEVREDEDLYRFVKIIGKKDNIKYGCDFNVIKSNIK